MSNVLGIEIGGTKLQFGVGEGASGKLLARERHAVDRMQGAAGILKTIEHVAPRLIAHYQIERIGIGFGGPVHEGKVICSHQVSGWESFPLASWCQEKFGCPTRVGNDCDVAALAEATYGAGSGQDIVFFVTVGTGIGGGLVIGGKLHGQGRPAVAEIGHLRPVTPCAWQEGPWPTVESQASGLGIVDTFMTFLRQSDDSRTEWARQFAGSDRWQLDREWVEERLAGWGDGNAEISAQHIAQWARQGNAVAQAALAHAIETLGWAIAQVITLVAPNVVVVGGGVSLLGEEEFFEPLRRAVLRYVFAPLKNSYRIVPAALGEWVVVVGAVALAAGP